MLFYILLASTLETLIALIGILFVFWGYERLKRFLPYLVSFSVGTLLAVVFLDLLPEAIKVTQSEDVFIYTLFGFLFFFVFSRLLHWYHHHEEGCISHNDIKTSGYLILTGDFIHNFIDGVIIALAFSVDVKVGIITTTAVLFHEIPQELADFFILVRSGFSKVKALTLNFIVALTTILGAVLTYFLTANMQNFIGPALGIVAGNFLYIATSDLLPSLHSKNVRQTFVQFLFILLGVGIIYVLTNVILI
jgi:zinc and cadmium transporter